MHTEEQEPCLSGWNAITEAFEKLYPDQKNPLHYGVLIPYALGGSDPLDGISIYDAGSYWHFVSYGLSELYEKQSEDLEYSGFGFEFTLKLSKAGIAPEQQTQELGNIGGILQSLARESFDRGEIFAPQEYIYTGQTAGFDAGQKSCLTGFVTRLDDAGEIDTPNGKVQFVQLIGVTDAELRQIMDGKLRVQALLDEYGSDLTDYTRKSLYQ